MATGDDAVREAHKTCFNCVGEVELRDDSEFNVDCHAHHAAIDRAIEAVRREHDKAWCGALIKTLDVDGINAVTTEFNRIRPDSARISKEEG